MICTLSRRRTTSPSAGTRSWTSRTRRWLVAPLFACAAIASSRSIPAQESDDPNPVPPPEPLVVLHVQSFERILNRLQDNLKEIDRDDVGKAYNEFLDTTVGGLKGFDRAQPFGVAMFLPESLPPRPVPVVYAPVSDIGQLIKTLELGPVTVTKSEEQDAQGERYTLSMQGGMKREIVVRDGYAFLSREEAFLDGDVASLARLAPRLGEKYDVAATVNIAAVNPLVRDVFLGFLRTQSQAELQQRDNEPTSEYIVRKANGLSTLELIEHVLRDGESLTLGLKFPEGSGNTVIELYADATPDSDFAQYLADLSAHPSSYASLVNDRDPLTFSASWMMAERERRLGRELISSFAHSMTDRLRVSEPAEGEPDPAARRRAAATFVPDPVVQPVLDVLNATVDSGHFDVCFQFRELEPGRFGLVGAMHVVGGDTLAAGIRELLTTLKSRGADLEITQDVAAHNDIALHRVRSPDQRSEDRRLYGDDSALYLGASDRTLWLAVGSSRVLTELNSAIDRVAAAAAQPATRQAPIQFIMQTGPWLSLQADEPDSEAGPAAEDDSPPSPDEQRRRRRSANQRRQRELSDEAFDSDNDGLRLEIRPTENGARVRIELEPGFTRMLSLMLADRYDRSRL